MTSAGEPTFPCYLQLDPPSVQSFDPGGGLSVIRAGRSVNVGSSDVLDAYRRASRLAGVRLRVSATPLYPLDTADTLRSRQASVGYTDDQIAAAITALRRRTVPSVALPYGAPIPAQAPNGTLVIRTPVAGSGGPSAPGLFWWDGTTETAFA